MRKIADKVALITGGNSGIGRACALRFVQEGAAVVIAARNQARAEETLEAVRSAGGQAIFVPCDVTIPEECASAVEKTVEEYGKLDILVNNAGIAYRNRDVVTTLVEEWDHTFAVNVNGTFYMCKYALPHLIKTKGTVVNVASYVGLVGMPNFTAYCASKGAVIQLTRAMALDHAAQGVRVNCVCPGSVDTPMIHSAWEQYGTGAEEIWKSKHPIGRIATAEEVAAAILYLASSESSFITGTALPVDGGITAG